LKKVFVFLGRLLIFFVALILFLWILLQTQLVQNFLVTQITKRLSKDLQTELSIKKVDFAFFNKMNMDGLLIKDQQKDTLLYAGKVKVRITDWFFLKDSVQLKYLGLEDAVIYQNRKDSIWNFQYMIDRFVSTDTVKTKRSINIDFKKIDFKNVTYYKKDEWVGEDMYVKVGSLLLDAKSIDIAKKNIAINSISLVKPIFRITNYTGKRRKKIKAVIPKNSMYFNEAGIQLYVGKIVIENGTIINDVKNHTTSVKGLFDDKNTLITEVTGTLANISFIKDTIQAQTNLHAKERCGLELKKLKAHLKLTPQKLELDSLDIITPKSRLRNYYAMRFNDFNKDMGNYIDAVTMDANIKNSTIHSDDIAYFASELKPWKKKLDISGKFLGTVANFYVKNMVLRSGSSTYVSGNLAMKGLPEINKTYITLTNANIVSSYNEMAIYVPVLKDIKQPYLPALGQVRYIGNFKGLINNFVTQGTLTSSLGAAYANVSMKLPKKGEPSYEATLRTNQFNIGKFLQIKDLGNITFNGKVKGNSFNLSKLNTTLDGAFSQLNYNNYNYTGLSFNGSFKQKFFKGEFIANDPNFNFTSNININLAGEKPAINVLGDLVNSNLKNLHFSNKKLEVSGLFDLNFTGNNIDDFLGEAKLLNAAITNEASSIVFDSLSLKSFTDTLGKHLAIASNEFEGDIVGNYSLLDLPNTFETFLHQYYPSLFNIPKQKAKDQLFVFNLKTRDFEKYAKIINPKFKGLNYATITGGIGTKDTGTFFLEANIPEVAYDKYAMENAKINAYGNYDAIDIEGDIGRLFLSDSTYLPHTDFSIASKKDHSTLRINTSANKVLNNAQLDADIYTLTDGARINFQPSSFVLNDKKWTLENKGEIVIRKNFASANNVKFTQGFQEIAVETEEEEGGNTNNLVVRLKDVNIGDFTPIFLTNPSIEGIANGEVHLKNFFGKFAMSAALKATELRLNNDSVGVVNLNTAYTSRDKILTYKVVSNNKRYNFLANGSYNTNDSISNPLVTNVDMTEMDISILNSFLSSLFSDIDGIAKGKLSISGSGTDIALDGDMLLTNGNIKVNYTQVTYTIDSAMVSLKKQLINLGSFTIKDKYGNSGKVNGQLTHTNFENMAFDFDITTNNMLLIDTRPKDNPMFYGKAIGKANFSFKGPESNMRMSITGEVTDTSNISIKTNAGSQNADANFIVFKQYGTEIIKPNSKETQLNIDLDLKANNKAKMNVILDELTGDVIKAEGSGRLIIKIPAQGEMSMNGRYNIEKGRYDFNFQSLVKKPFELKEGAGNYIEWKGSPYDATLKIDAQYTAERVSLNDLINRKAVNLGTNLSAYKGEVYVVAKITDKLSKPKIDFALRFPSSTGFQNDDTFQRFLTSLESDPNEMLKQVTWLIVFGSFAPYQESSGGIATGIRFESIGVNTISQQLTAELNKIISNVLFKLTGDKSLQFDLGATTYSSGSLYNSGGNVVNSNRLDRQQVNLKLNKSILDGKIVIAVGGDLDFNWTASSQLQSGNFQWLPDISIQVILSTDRRLRAVVFNKSTLDVNNSAAAIGRRNRQGISLSYSKDFNKYIFKKEQEPIGYMLKDKPLITDTISRKKLKKQVDKN